MKISKRNLKRIIREEYARIINESLSETSDSSNSIGELVVTGKEGAMQALFLVNDDLRELNSEFGKYLEGLMKRVISASLQVNPRAMVDLSQVEYWTQPDINVYRSVEGYGSIPVKNPTGAKDEYLWIGGSVSGKFMAKNEEHFDLSINYNPNMEKVFFHLRQDTYTKSGRRRNRINKNYLDSEHAIIDEVNLNLKGKIK